MKGSKITFRWQKPAIIAMEVKKGDEVLEPRDDAGFPVWPVGAEANWHDTWRFSSAVFRTGLWECGGEEQLSRYGDCPSREKTRIVIAEPNEANQFCFFASSVCFIFVFFLKAQPEFAHRQRTHCR